MSNDEGKIVRNCFITHNLIQIRLWTQITNVDEWLKCLTVWRVLAINTLMLFSENSEC